MAANWRFTMTKIHMLFLAANPQDTTQLALDEEIREITQKIRLSEGRDVLDVVSAWAVRPDDLLQYFNQYNPQIVHFSGHGSGAGEIVLVDNNRKAKPVSPRALTALFTAMKDNIQIVVLNACYSRLQGEAIGKVIDYVVGMNSTIGDKAAIVFAASFYRALGFNRTVQEAFDQARTALLLEGIPEEDTPELLVKTGASPHKKILTIIDSSFERHVPILSKLEVTYVGFTHESEFDITVRNLGDDAIVINQISILLVKDHFIGVAPVLQPTAHYKIPVDGLKEGESRSIRISHVIDAHKADRFLIALGTTMCYRLRVTLYYNKDDTVSFEAETW